GRICRRIQRRFCSSPESDADVARTLPHENFWRVRERASRTEWNQAVARDRQACALDPCVAKIEAVVIGNSHRASTDRAQIFKSGIRRGNNFADSRECARRKAFGIERGFEICE